MLYLIFAALLIESIAMYVVFINISRVTPRTKDAVITVFVLLLGFLFVFSLFDTMQVASIVGNVFFISIMVIKAFKQIKNIHLCIFFAVFTNIIFLLSASVISVLFDIVLTGHFDEMGRNLILNNLILHITYTLFAFAMAFIISLKIGKMLHEHIELLEKESTPSMYFFLSGISILTLIPYWAFSFFWEYIFIEPQSPIINALSFLAYFVLLSFALLLFTRIVRKEADLRINEEALRNMHDYSLKVENMATGVLKFKHDHYNLLLGLRGFIEDGDLTGLNVYYQQYMNTFQDETAIGSAPRLDMLHKVAPPVLKSLIAAKLLYTQQLSIEIYIEIPNEIVSVNSGDLLDVCRVIGILFDNAIESCSDEPNSKLSFGAATIPTGIALILENTCSSPPPPIEEMFDGQYSTKGVGRGIGLHNVSQVLKKNDSLSLETKYESGNFTQMLTVKHNSS